MTTVEARLDGLMRVTNGVPPLGTVSEWRSRIAGIPWRRSKTTRRPQIRLLHTNRSRGPARTLPVRPGVDSGPPAIAAGGAGPVDPVHASEPPYVTPANPPELVWSAPGMVLSVGG